MSRVIDLLAMTRIARAALRKVGGAGTGLIISKTGDVLTNNHVVGGSHHIRVVLVSSGATYVGSLVGADPPGAARRH